MNAEKSQSKSKEERDQRNRIRREKYKEQVSHARFLFNFTIHVMFRYVLLTFIFH